MLEQFGYKSVRHRGIQPAGFKPLLVVLVDGEGRPPLAHGVPYYDDLFFGPTGSVASYFDEISHGRFSWVRAGAGVQGPIRLSKYEMALDLERRFAVIKEKLVEEGYDYHLLDQNEDGIVGSEDLAMIVIDSDSMDQAAARGTDPDCLDFGGRRVKWCGGACSIGHQASTMTAAHELLHVIGVDPDMYGSDDLNRGYTTMCATIEGVPDVRTRWHLDPFHKMKLGWIEPRLHNGYRADSFTLRTHRFGDPEAAVLIYDPNDDTRKSFFIVEYRTSKADVVHDSDLPTSGVAVWSVDLDESRNAFLVDSLKPNTDDKDWSVNLVGPPNWQRGRGPLWGTGDTPLLRSHWKNRLRIAPFAPSAREVAVAVI